MIRLVFLFLLALPLAAEAALPVVPLVRGLQLLDKSIRIGEKAWLIRSLSRDLPDVLPAVRPPPATNPSILYYRTGMSLKFERVGVYSDDPDLWTQKPFKDPIDFYRVDFRSDNPEVKGIGIDLNNMKTFQDFMNGIVPNENVYGSFVTVPYINGYLFSQAYHMSRASVNDNTDILEFQNYLSQYREDVYDRDMPVTVFMHTSEINKCLIRGMHSARFVNRFGLIELTRDTATVKPATAKVIAVYQSVLDCVNQAAPSANLTMEYRGPWYVQGYDHDMPRGDTFYPEPYAPGAWSEHRHFPVIVFRDSRGRVAFFDRIFWGCLIGYGYDGNTPGCTQMITGNYDSLVSEQKDGFKRYLLSVNSRIPRWALAEGYFVRGVDQSSSNTVTQYQALYPDPTDPDFTLEEILAGPIRGFRLKGEDADGKDSVVTVALKDQILSVVQETLDKATNELLQRSVSIDAKLGEIVKQIQNIGDSANPYAIYGEAGLGDSLLIGSDGSETGGGTDLDAETKQWIKNIDHDVSAIKAFTGGIEDALREKGEKPDVSEPPDFEDSFFKSVFDGLKGWRLPACAGVCPTAAIEAFGTIYPFDQHCALFDRFYIDIQAVMTAVWLVLALFIVLRA